MLFNKLSIYTKFFNVSIVIVIHLHSRRIGKLHRIAEAIQVSVVVQPVVLVSDERIGAEETAGGWLVDDSSYFPLALSGSRKGKGQGLCPWKTLKATSMITLKLKLYNNQYK